MKTKNFFKPSKVKVILAFILFFIGLIVGDNIICPPYLGCEPVSLLTQVTSHLTLLPLAVYVFMKFEFGLLFLLPLAFYYYALSCAATSIFLRIKTKK